MNTETIFPGRRAVTSSNSAQAWLHDYKNQQLQANTQGTANFSSSNTNFSGDAYIDFMLGLANSFTQLQYLSDKHWVNNNYNGYVNDNWHVNRSGWC